MCQRTYNRQQLTVRWGGNVTSSDSKLETHTRQPSLSLHTWAQRCHRSHKTPVAVLIILHMKHIFNSTVQHKVVQLNNKMNKLRNGMFCQMTFEIGNNKIILLTNSSCLIYATWLLEHRCVNTDTYYRSL